MKLPELIPLLEIMNFSGPSNIDITGVTCDSRKVKHGDIFVSIKGLKTDGHLFASDAVKNGAVVVVAENRLDLPVEITRIQVENSRKTLSLISDLVNGKPTSNLMLVGVTGTNGKTTTTFLLESIFASSGKKTGLVGTIEYRIGNKVLPVERTTPEACDLHKIFSQMHHEGVDVAVMEVSSHAIDLHRVDHCRFDAAIFTNLSQDHLDYHKTMEEYFKAKVKVFKNTFDKPTVHVLNIDDPYGQEIARMSTSKVVTYGVNSSEADIRATNIKINKSGSEFKVSTSTGDLCINSQLKGIYNVYNSLAAIATALSLNVSRKAIKEGIENVLKIPGRFEIIDSGPYYKATVVVDYAHTPDSLEKVIKTVKEIAEAKVITVFGCGGDRDRTKRPEMGEVAARLSDFTILTSDNPRSEEPEKIIDEIETGVKKVKEANYICLTNRHEAINAAIKMAKKGDFVIIAGKGHEKGQIFKDKVLPFSDQEVASEAMRRFSSCSI